MDQEFDVTKLRYVLYARKRTVDEQNQVRSIEDQIAECEDLAKLLKLTYIWIIYYRNEILPLRNPTFTKTTEEQTKFLQNQSEVI